MKTRDLKAAATASLVDNCQSPRRIALVCVGVSLLASLALLVLNYFVGRQLEGATGLAQLGNRAVLNTVQSVASLVITGLLPFWQIGFYRAALRVSRDGSATTGDLKEGFRRFGPVLRTLLLQMLMLLGVALVCYYASLTVYLFILFYLLYMGMAVPLPGPLADFLRPLTDLMAQVEADPQTVITQEMVESLVPVITPMYALFIALLLAVAIPLFYRLRLAPFAIMDDAPGAFAAVGRSFRLPRRSNFLLLRLDLSFWWYYLLQAAILLVANADLILGLTGLSLPLPEPVLYFLPFAVGAVAQLVCAWCFDSFVQVTFARCYDSLREKLPPPRTRAPQNPWQR